MQLHTYMMLRRLIPSCVDTDSDIINSCILLVKENFAIRCLRMYLSSQVCHEQIDDSGLCTVYASCVVANVGYHFPSGCNISSELALLNTTFSCYTLHSGIGPYDPSHSHSNVLADRGWAYVCCRSL